MREGWKEREEVEREGGEEVREGREGRRYEGVCVTDTQESR